MTQSQFLYEPRGTELVLEFFMLVGVPRCWAPGCGASSFPHRLLQELQTAQSLRRAPPNPRSQGQYAASLKAPPLPAQCLWEP